MEIRTIICIFAALLVDTLEKIKRNRDPHPDLPEGRIK